MTNVHNMFRICPNIKHSCKSQLYKTLTLRFSLCQNSFYTTSSQNSNVKVSKENKTLTILIFVQIYSSNLWVNFCLQKLRISKISKLESCRYLSHGSNPSSLVSIGFLRREIRLKYWSVLKPNFFLFRFCLFDFFLYLKLPNMVDDPSTPTTPP